MRRWVVLFMVGVLFLSNFGFAGQFQEVKDSQVPVNSGTCGACSSCQDFDVGKALVEVNLKIENLTRIINQKEAELQKLYAEFNRTKSIKTLEKIVKLEDDIQLLKSEREFYKRQKIIGRILNRYSGKNLYTIYDSRVIIDNYTKEVQKLLPMMNKTIETPSELAELYWNLAQDTFNEIMTLETNLQIIFKKLNKKQDLSVYIPPFLKEKRKLWNKIYQYLRKRDELYTYAALEKTRREQIPRIGMFGIVPLSSSPSPWECWVTSGGVHVCREIEKGEVVNCCPDPLGHPLGDGTNFVNLRPSAVWIGMYSDTYPSGDSHVADYCLYKFPSSNTPSVIFETYKPYVDYMSGKYNLNIRSIQIKFFYTATAYNMEVHTYQQTHLIFQYNCYMSTGYCQPSASWLRELPANPQNPPYSMVTNLMVWPYVLACKYKGDCGLACEWANGHCRGCFAPDDTASQYFAKK